MRPAAEPIVGPGAGGRVLRAPAGFQVECVAGRGQSRAAEVDVVALHDDVETAGTALLEALLHSSAPRPDARGLHEGSYQGDGRGTGSGVFSDPDDRVEEPRVRDGPGVAVVWVAAVEVAPLPADLAEQTGKPHRLGNRRVVICRPDGVLAVAVAVV